ncbi:sigma-70 family RNA polymerase sigma factor [Tissierella pigra]|nr:sigma-70 family RNA polymerase sigma factor [Tissierella pigra]
MSNRQIIKMSSYFILKEVVILEKLVLKAIKGDGESFGLLINSKKEDLYRIAYSYVHNEQDALDIIGEAVYKSYISISKLKHPEYFNTWIVRIVINCAINFINKSKRILYLDNKTIESLNNEKNDIVESIDLKEALEKLDHNYKIVIILRYSQNLKLKEIAEILELPLSTVKTRLYKAIELLKIELKEGEDFE